MGLKRIGREFLDALVSRYGYRIMETSLLYSWQLAPQTERSYNKRPLPEGAEDYLRSDNERLSELEKKYRTFDPVVTHPLFWNDQFLQPDDLRFFRGCNAYVWQLRGQNLNPSGYALTTYYVKAIDSLGLFEQLTEDEYFGVHTFQIDNKTVSRDLLDSILEIHFLERNLAISQRAGLRVLDIGAGYGRLAHRLLTGLPNVESYTCTDAVAISTFISEYYLRFRRVNNKGKVVPLFDIDEVLKRQGADLAVNVHSFSECTPSAIEWWLTRLERSGVRHLMIVPNPTEYGGARLMTNRGDDFSGIVDKAGYRLVAKEPKYQDAIVQEFGILPTFYYLFELG